MIGQQRDDGLFHPVHQLADRQPVSLQIEQDVKNDLAGAMVGDVATTVNLGPIALTEAVVVAALACIGATCCYGFANVYIKKYVRGISNLNLAAGTLALATIVVGPVAISVTPWHAPTNSVPYISTY